MYASSKRSIAYFPTFCMSILVVFRPSLDKPSIYLRLKLILYCIACNFREEPVDYGSLEESIRLSAKKMNLQDVDGMIKYCDSVCL